jgi:hypothetical protein
MPAFPWKEQKRLVAAVEALNEWTTAASALHLRVPNLTVELLDETGTKVVGAAVFELDTDGDQDEPPQYGYRTL